MKESFTNIEHSSQARAILQLVNNDEKLKSKFEKYKEKFTPKPYIQENRPLQRIAIFFKYFCSLISILLAFYIGITLAFEALNNWAMALVLALSVLAAIEMGKHTLLPHNIRQYYLYQKTNFWFTILNVGLIVLSIFLSVKGIEKYNEEKMQVSPTLVDTKVISHEYESKILRVEQKYDLQIKEIQREEIAYKKSVTWNGSIDITNEATKRKIADYSSQIRTFREAKLDALNDIEKERQEKLRKAESTNSSRLHNAQQKTQANAFYLTGFASLNEIIGVICLWYLTYFQFRGFKQIEEARQLIIQESPEVLENKPRSLVVLAREQGMKVTKKQAKILELVERGFKKQEIHKNTGYSRSTITDAYKKFNALIETVQNVQFTK